MCGRFTLTVNPADLQETFQDYTFPKKFAPQIQHRPHPAGAGHPQ